MKGLGPKDRYTEDDELVIHNPKLVHLERMSDGCWWMGITMPDGETLHVDLMTPVKCRHKIQIAAGFR